MTITPSANDTSTSRYDIPLFLALIVAGFAGNYFPFSILNAHFIFGSIFAMLALQLFGFGWGVVAAAIISGYTYLAWNHPWAIVTMTAEVAVVGLLIRTRKMNLVIADTLYWLLIGIPLGYLCFHVIANFPVSNTMFLMTKQAINGIANALVARLIFTGYSFRSKALLISFRENMSNLLVFFVLCTALAMLTADSKTDFTKTDHQIRASLNWDSQDMTDCLENWVKERSLPIANLARMAETLSPTQMQLRLEQAKASDINFLRIALIDKEGAAVAYSPLADELGRNNIGKNFADRPYIPALKQTLKPMLSQVIVSRFGRPDPIAIMLAPVVSRGGYEGAVGGILNFDRIQSVMKTTFTNQDTLYTLLDKNDNVFITNRKDQQVMAPFFRGKGTLKRLDEGTSQWIPALPPNTSTIELWGKSFYVAESTIGNLAKWTLILEQPVEPFQKKLYGHYTGRFYMLFIFLLVSLALAEFLSRLIVKTTEQLSQITHDLPAKVASDSAIVWPESTIVETNQLIGNFREMADSLKAKFIENRQINESLEQKVKERTEELRESEEQYKTIMDNLPVAVYQNTPGPDGQFLKANPAFCKMFGFKNEEEVKKVTPSELYQNPEERKRYSDSLIEKGVIRNSEWTLLRRDGTPIHTSITSRVVRGKDGEVSHFDSIMLDITEQKFAEDALRNSEEKYRTMMETMKEPVYICSPDYQIEYINSAMIRRIGRDATGENCFKALHGLEEKCSWCLHDKVKKGEYFETEIVSPKDNRSYQVSSSPIVHGDGSVSEMTVFRDTTDFLRLQSQLQQSHKMESIGTLAGGIAHDFNNILGIILGNAELVMDDVPEWNRSRQNLDEIRKACLRAKDVVRQILSFSRKSEMEQKPINIATVVTESLKLLRASIPTSIEIRQNIANDVAEMLGDSTQIHQVMINLCTNAAHAMEDDGGTLEVTLESKEIDEDTASQYPELNPGPYVQLLVSDTGGGISPEILDRIFDPYFTTKDVGKGTGLGLSVVHGIVNAHHGRISVESKTGKGTTFNILFPAVKGKTRDEPKEFQELPTGKERILFVDDEESMVNLNQQRLERLGYKVIPKTDPSKALEFFRSNPEQIDLIITDMTMPKMTGDRLAQEILKIRPDMPIILCTGYSQRMSEDKAQELGIRKYIEKPIEMENLARSVREVLDGE